MLLVDSCQIVGTVHFHICWPNVQFPLTVSENDTRQNNQQCHVFSFVDKTRCFVPSATLYCTETRILTNIPALIKAWSSFTCLFVKCTFAGHLSSIPGVGMWLKMLVHLMPVLHKPLDWIHVTILLHYLDRMLCNLFDIFANFCGRNVMPLWLTHAVVLVGVVVTVRLAITVPQERNAATRQTLELIKLTLPLFWKQKCMTWSLRFVQFLCKRSAFVVAALNELGLCQML